MVQAVPETIDFPKEEENILQLWKNLDAFRECLKQSKGKPRYSFYDGPPFATGLPHYGHILAGAIKDVVTRYAHQSGFHVERRFGWDCHGLPVEFEIDKNLGIKGPADVAKMGIAAYNNECRKIVMRYASEWETIVTRIGRWIDFQNDYKTLYPSFMESVWWVFSELWNKGLVYRGVKVMPYSTACNTPLSNFESGQNYKEVVDPAVVVSFPLVDDPDTAIIAWTTTPWTLPSNLALCVNPDLTYVKVRDFSTNKVYIMMEARLQTLFKKEDEYKILQKFLGKTLAGKKYKPIFPYYAHLKQAFRVLCDGYVTEESGTGIVHQAPYFGEDDYRVCLANGVITRDQEIICPVDESGCFTLPVTDFNGLYVKEADKEIIKKLKADDRLVNAGSVKHSYPFCWRSETPLIYKAVPSWFIRVEQMSEHLIKANSDTYWVPDFVKEKRFGNWLREARDWAVSRNRYWGTPIPLWASEDWQEVVCVSSIAQLQQLTGQPVADLHRDSIDHLTIPSVRPGQPPLRRVPEVFDCWFESGSMPYAQLHYPFENKKDFDDRFPADFIAEGIDQTRGWFYTLLVISTALFKKAPFKNLIANGLVLASDGQKMSKRKKNYPDPMEIVHKYGADALRLYLVNSPVVRAENLRFKEEGVRDILKDVFLPWYNAYRFLIQNIQRINQEESITFSFNEESATSTNIMDRWILSFTQSLLAFIRREMGAYRLYTVVPRLVQFIDNLTNWYVRMNRRRLKGEGGVSDCQQALATLSTVLFTMVRVMAPYTPFLTELMYQNLRQLTHRQEKSVHFVMMPQPRTSLIDEDIERAVSRMQSVIELGRKIRDRKTLPIKYPLPEVVVIVNSETQVSEVLRLQQYITEELNVRKVTVTADKQTYGVSLRAEPDHKTLGARLKQAFKPVMAAIKELTNEQLQEFQQTQQLEVLGQKIDPSELRLFFSFTGPGADLLAQKYEATSDNDVLVLLDVTPDQELQAEGLAREFVNRVQKLRKKAHLVPTDQVTVYYDTEGELADIAVKYHQFIETATRTPFKPMAQLQGKVMEQEVQQVKGSKLTLKLTDHKEGQATKPSITPACRYVRVVLQGLEPSNGVSGSIGYILLENPAGENLLTLQQLEKEVRVLFGLQCRSKVFLYTEEGKLLSQDIMSKLHQTSVFVTGKPTETKLSSQPRNGPDCRFVNVQWKDKQGVLFLENPVGDGLPQDQDLASLQDLARRLFHLEGKAVTVSKPDNGVVTVT
ncbi:isoleucine--tRNA ligase, cytoplasmic [Macrosteles quadrilineatus]|uniref:isoleucine--tRNA ligase, cytoplasmic n=1 Tax=Macrosteles quadrilineatus TaxID=74068 RepID=UPI0023E2700C|nr:isoleucine--tRNA ligase, cytoplasmic [Macrosteles quadrilineatus]